MNDTHQVEGGLVRANSDCNKAPPPHSRSLGNNRGLIAFLLIVGCVLSFTIGIFRMRYSYQNANQTAYNSFYQAAFDFAEAKNHVSNDVVIDVANVREVSRLEVLTVSGSEFVIKNADGHNKTTSWLEVQGTGVFTVDLSAGEFIVDSGRRSVLVRVPQPTLTECTVSGTGKQFLRDGRVFSNGSVADGVRLSQNQLSEGKALLQDSMKKSQDFHAAAKTAAVHMIESLIQQWNPNIPGLNVDVEFFEAS